LYAQEGTQTAKGNSIIGRGKQGQHKDTTAVTDVPITHRDSNRPLLRSQQASVCLAGNGHYERAGHAGCGSGSASTFWEVLSNATKT